MPFAFDIDTETSRILRASVADAAPDGTVEVETEELGTVRCDVLQSSDVDLRLERGDTILLWHSGRPADHGVILGRIGSNPRVVPKPADAASEPPDELVIEAKRSLTLRVGDGSITIRDDGKILIRGKDLVSHAQRMNRIKGGTVAIN